MKRVISVLLLLSLTLSFSACTPHRSEEFSCEDIMAAYGAAGYTLGHHLHEDPVYTQEGISCSLLFEDPENPDKNYIYINRHYTTRGARKATIENKYNPILWFISTLYGEGRWLRSERFGTLHYTTFEDKMITPLRDVITR